MAFPIGTATLMAPPPILHGVGDVTGEGRGRRRGIEAEPSSPGAGVQSGQLVGSRSGTASVPQGAVAQRGQPQEAPVAFILGLAECARAVRGAAFLEPEACAEAAEAAEVPKWKDVPKACGFKVERLSSGGRQHWATKEEQRQQCQEYRLYATWARQACLLSEAEFKAQLSAAHQLHRNQFGLAGLPACLHCKLTTVRNHAVLLCRAAGLRSGQ